MTENRPKNNNFPTTPVCAPKTAAQHQLELSFDEGENFFVKIGETKFLSASFAHGDLALYRYSHNKDNRSGARGELITPHGIGWLRERSEQEAGGVLLAGCGVNPLTHYKEHQTQTRDLMFECDQLSIELQWKQIRWFEELTGLRFLTLFTGGKSLHAHLYCQELLSQERAMFYRKCLATLMMSDVALTRPSQPYRLAGFFRKGKDKEQTLFQKGARYPESQIRLGLQKAFEARGLDWFDGFGIDHFGLIKKAIASQDFAQVQRAVNHGLEQLKRETAPRVVTPHTLDTTTEVLKALWVIPPNCGYENWVTVGMALHAFDPNLFGEWDQWSRGASKYRGERVLAQMWRGFSASGGVGVGSLFHIAKEYGYNPPGKKRAAGARKVQEERVDLLEYLDDQGRKFVNFLVRANRRRIGFSPSPQEPRMWDQIIPIADWVQRSDQPQVVEFDSTTPRAAIVLATLQAGYSQGRGFVIDKSAMGAGKSHNEADFATRRVIEFTDSKGQPRFSRAFYISQKYGEPTVKQWEKALKLPARSRENCIYFERFHAAFGLGYNLSGENPICGRCPNLKNCRATEGWFKADRASVLGQGRTELTAVLKPAVRATLPQVPRGDFDHGDTHLIIDEAESLPKLKTLQVGLTDIDTTWVDLTTLAPELAEKLSGLFTKLRGLFQFQGGRFGLSSEETRRVLGDLGPEVLTELDIFYLSEYEALNKDRLARGQSAPSNFLPLLTDVLRGNGAIRFTGKHISLTQRDSQYDALFKQAHQIRVLDATANVEKVAALLGFAPNQVLLIQARSKPVQNLHITLVKTPGLRSNDWSERARARVKAAVAEIQCGDRRVSLITHKKQKSHFFDLGLERVGHWFHDNVGSNDFTNHEVLIMVGTPFNNIGVVEDECVALGLNFSDVYLHSTLEQVIQGLGRQRPSRNNSKQFELFWFLTASDEEIDTMAQHLSNAGFAHIEVTTAGHITPLAGSSQQQRTFQVVLEGVKLMAKGVKVTQERVAEVLGVTGETLRRGVKCPWHLIQNLIHNLCCPKNPQQSPVLDYRSLWGKIKATLESETVFLELAQVWEVLQIHGEEGEKVVKEVLSVLIPDSEKLLAILILFQSWFKKFQHEKMQT